MKYPFVTALTLLLGSLGCASTHSLPQVQYSETQQVTSAPLTTDSPGKAADAARRGVLRVYCRTTSLAGTSFLHKSGKVITAAHIVAGCQPSDLFLVTSLGQVIKVAAVQEDDAKDVALITPLTAVPGKPLTLATSAVPTLGMQVTTWGYPGGYDGLLPLLSVGYFSGVQEFQTPQQGAVIRWVINAAFNGGNSGGPVLSVEDGRVIGVVSSKLAPLPPEISQILELLRKQTYGLIYEGTRADGSKISLSEAQIIVEVLQYLRSQVQLVVGYAVSIQDVGAFLTANGVTP